MITKEINKKELLDHKDYMKVGDLRKFLDRHELADDAIVVIQRVEDTYYENNGWGVYLKDGDYTHHMRLLKEMGDDVSDEEIRDTMSQYHPAWCCVRFRDDKDVLFIDMHY